MDRSFNYQSAAFSRNTEWVTETAHAFLRTKCIAIAGLTGVGGSHLPTLTRLGIGNFNTSNLDRFQLAYFKRQAGATQRHFGSTKVDASRNRLAITWQPDGSSNPIQKLGPGIVHKRLSACRKIHSKSILHSGSK